jgi:hypothetical protein
MEVHPFARVPACAGYARLKIVDHDSQTRNTEENNYKAGASIVNYLPNRLVRAVF